MQRRSFLSLAAGALSAAAVDPLSAATSQATLHPVLSGMDRSGEAHNLGITTITFKVATQDSNGGLFVIEHATRQKGGPPRHIHPYQDEWFYVMEGEFLFEIGDDRLTLGHGDSILAPRNRPHAWAFVGSTGGKMLISYTPAGKMEAFFRDVSRGNAMPPQDAALFRKYDLELVGPPLSV
ncbi:quercetin dioxygenase-like cupin family protein [Silvibacterium bohemicum]|uniref:Quercetin dioxygenase-like cupin family protein n=1 Tax=Silvibacterium bohemicum TaxID=1577686 RepID=A0A841JU78_9BACT|nr:cupin domain-containing protein [Silvibacterium bohemicum]MBB6144065.1 quercetin dioxygenase-like cupin family protein [Silvibacterium bohemicum]